jgi:hypothetical protein
MSWIWPGGPLLLLLVDEEQANLEGGGCVGFGIGGSVGLGVGNLAVATERDGVYFWGGSGAQSGSRDRAAEGTSVAVMPLEAPCFLRDKLLTRGVNSER